MNKFLIILSGMFVLTLYAEEPNYLPLPEADSAKDVKPVAVSMNLFNAFERGYLDKKYLCVFENITAEKIAKIKYQAKRNKNPFYQCILGMLYEKGIGTRQSLVKSTTWLERAGKKGDPEAQFRLGIYHKNGYLSRNFFKEVMKDVGLLKERRSSVYWFEKASLQEHAAAQYALGIHYIEEWDEAKRDINKARYWLQRASENGDSRAEKKLEMLTE